MNDRYFNPRNASIAVMVFAATALFVFKTADCNIMYVATPIVLTLVGLILSHALLQELFSKSVCRVTLEKRETAEAVATPNPQSAPALDRYEILQAEALRKEQKRRQDTLAAVNEYVTIVTAGYLSKKSLATLLDNIGRMATGCTEPYQPLSSDMEKKLKSPDLRHLAWNIGERLGVSRRERARFIQASFPYELKNATLEYLELNLRDLVPANIKIDIPDKGDFRFHYEAENAA